MLQDRPAYQHLMIPAASYFWEQKEIESYVEAQNPYVEGIPEEDVREDRQELRQAFKERSELLTEYFDRCPYDDLPYGHYYGLWVRLKRLSENIDYRENRLTNFISNYKSRNYRERLSHHRLKEMVKDHRELHGELASLKVERDILQLELVRLEDSFIADVLSWREDSSQG